MSRKKQRISGGGARFLDVEAEVSSGDEDDEEAEGSCDEAFYIEDEADDDTRPSAFIAQYCDRSSTDLEVAEAEELAALYAKKDCIVADGYNEESRGSAKWITGLTYWMVHVRSGHELSTSERINKLLPDGMQAIASSSLKGRIYVSCPKGIDAPPLVRLYGWPTTTAYVHRSIIPLSDTDALQVVEYISERHAKTLAPGSWVKIMHGLYEGDIGRVYSNDVDTDELVLQVVPRINGNKKRRNRSNVTVNGPALCLPAAMDHVGDTEDGLPGATQAGPFDDTITVGNDVVLFTNGLQRLQVMGLHYVQKYEPLAREVALFTLAGVDTLTVTNKAFLNKGDRVLVTNGEYVSLTGIVRSREASSALVLLDAQNSVLSEQAVSVAFDSIERTFCPGDQVIVRLGECEGRRGLVLDTTEERYLAILDVETKQEWSVPKAFVQSLKPHYDMPTISILRPGKHPALNKHVFVRSHNRFGHVQGILVETFGTTYFVDVLGLNLRQFSGNELVSTDDWLTLDKGAVPDVENIKTRFSALSSRLRVTIEDKPKERYIDTLPTRNHIVFVTHSLHKSFAQFVGTNGKGSALVAAINTGKSTVEAIASDQAISMIFLRRLDGSWPGNTKALRARYYEQFGHRRMHGDDLLRSKGPSIPVQDAISADIDKDESLKTSPLSEFIMEESMIAFVKDYYIVFKFKPVRGTLRNVDRMLAWTTPDTMIRAHDREIKLRYTAKSGGVTEGYVPIDGLETCLPFLHSRTGDHALVIDGEMKGKIVYPARFDKTAVNSRDSIYCKLEQSAKKRDEVPFSRDTITKARPISRGPPSRQ